MADNVPSADYQIYVVGVAGGGLLGSSIALNAISVHATCTVVFVVVAAVVGCSIASIQTLDRISWLGWAGLVSIMTSVITLAVSVSLQDRPAAAPIEGPFTINQVVVQHPSFVVGINALSNIIFSSSGGATLFNVFSEMRHPRDYEKVIVTSMTLVTTIYLVIGCVVYHYVGEWRQALFANMLLTRTGQYVASPALGSAGPLLKRITYGIALPGLIVGVVLNTHLAGKTLFVRFMRDSPDFTRPTRRHYLVWG